MNIDGKHVLVTGGTGSLGQVLVRRMLAGEFGEPEKVIVFSRDEARQHAMRLELLHFKFAATDDVIFKTANRCLQFRIGDVRDPASVRAALAGVDVVVNAAAMKQVPSCEYFPEEAHQTNVTGAINLFNAVREMQRPPEVVVGVSTDKAVKPVNVMGITKALQERVFIRANLDCPNTRFVVVRYGNVIASRGSVVPLFLDQIKAGGPLTVTDNRMTRFLVSLDQAVDVIADAVAMAGRGDIYVPRASAARVLDLARALCEAGSNIPVEFTGIRPGEKLHEVLVSEEEISRTSLCGKNYVIHPMLPELSREIDARSVLKQEYSSENDLLDQDQLRLEVSPGGALYHGLWVLNEGAF
ncbi:polysaccharide biosynthesis protein [Parahaliea aestuarii]|uniref:NAD-dependent epimerase/dehydratase family protein n=1 Tax=Parahaliea aestuarii TaxID=1852021 RepID=A0A5C8ZNS4_9GAMM|nr:polysaccharide biosynthesis protein [Parahaliea aestuarii]TXS89414.1 NAD-dependent epimerase/dehydratase family protein [Parahaliea aestuarii]